MDANKLVADVCELLRRTLGETIVLETMLGDGLWRTYADANQLENALLNLGLNARDAMPDGGKLIIETANATLDKAYIASLGDSLEPGEFVLIAVTDTGVGMDKTTQERAFDPFFTTKEVGKGTGLGLSQVYGFARQSAGHVRIYSEIRRRHDRQDLSASEPNRNGDGAKRRIEHALPVDWHRDDSLG